MVLYIALCLNIGHHRFPTPSYYCPMPSLSCLPSALYMCFSNACIHSSVPDEDFEPFNNVTVGTADQAVLTPFRPSHCFTIALLARPDDGLDDRSFFVALSVREGSNNIEPSPDRIRAPSADLQVTIQPCEYILVHIMV